MPRLFIAVDPTDAVRDALAAVRDDHLDVRWSRREQFHLTLRFVGEADSATTARLAGVLATIDAAPFAARPCRGVGAFPSMRRPRVLIVGLERNRALVALHEAVEQAVRRLGFEPERRAYRPHLTLGRLKRADHGAVRDYLRRHHDLVVPPFDVSAFHLYESELHPDGARYRRLASYPLAQ